MSNVPREVSASIPDQQTTASTVTNQPTHAQNIQTQSTPIMGGRNEQQNLQSRRPRSPP